MFLEIFSKTDMSEKQDVRTYEEENQYLEAFVGDSLLITTAQELNQLKEGLSN
ncbi:MAG: hypothetical protein OEZ43_00775 [Gammaproteobacteria bacterium]|nr:hypothetical protein [Gammaproteobacteria bacterium]